MARMIRLCPKCESRMEPVNMRDARNSHGLWVDAEFEVCTKCSYPVFRFVESSLWRIIVDSNGYPHEMEKGQNDTPLTDDEAQTLADYGNEIAQQL